MRLVVISDTHELHRQLVVPEGDIFVHCGDWTFFSGRQSMAQDFHRWLGELPHRWKVCVPGNHHLYLHEARHRAEFRNAQLLIDDGIEVGGLRIWGSPMCPLTSGAFAEPEAAKRKRNWARIPAGTDVLITHIPPFGILDCPPGSDEHEGCAELLEAIERVQPRVHLFGHVHGAYGQVWVGRTLFVNAALFGELGDLDLPPIVIDFS